MGSFGKIFRGVDKEGQEVAIKVVMLLYLVPLLMPMTLK